MNTKKVLLYSFLAIILIIGIASNTQRSLNWDEPIFIMNGLYYLQEGQAYNSNQPLLSSLLSAIPLSFTNTVPIAYEDLNYLFKDARNYFPYYSDNNIDTIAFYSRLASILASLFLAIFVYRWAKELYGKKAGLFAMFLYTFSITCLAWAVSATPDMITTTLSFISLYYFWHYCKKEKKKQLIIAAICFGLAVAAKITALFMLPIFLCCYLLYHFPKTAYKTKQQRV